MAMNGKILVNKIPVTHSLCLVDSQRYSLSLFFTLHFPLPYSARCCFAEGLLSFLCGDRDDDGDDDAHCVSCREYISWV